MLNYIAQSITFGSDRQACNVYIDKASKGYSIDGLTMAICFDKEGRLILDNLTWKTETQVQYDNQEPGLRSVFKWYLFPDTTIYVKAGGKLAFKIISPKHGINRTAYERLRDSWVILRNNARSHTIPPAVEPPGPLTRFTNPKSFGFRCPYNELGRGTHGRVILVADASTGHVFAAK